MRFQRETDTAEGSTVSHEVLGEIFRKILSMTDRNEDSDLPSRRGIEMVLLALEEMPDLTKQTLRLNDRV